MRHRISAYLALAMLTAVPGSAQGCDPQGNQAQLNQCADEAYRAADDALNARWREVVARFADAPASREFLVQAQRAWIAFRDAECDFAASGVAGGSIHPMIFLGCRTRLTEARTAELAAYLACEEGDLACPLP